MRMRTCTGSILVVAAVMGGCPGGAGEAPQIETFAATPDAVVADAPTQVAWTWSYANTPVPAPMCTIADANGTEVATSDGSTTSALSSVTLSDATQFTLTCTSEAGSSDPVSATISTTIAPAPACNQTRVLGSGGIAEAMETICRQWGDNSFESNIDAILAAMVWRPPFQQSGQPDQGIRGGPYDSQSREKVEFIILCGRPPFPTMTLPGDRQCAGWASDLFGDSAFDAANPAIPEWTFYRQFLQRANWQSLSQSVAQGSGGNYLQLDEAGRKSLSKNFLHTMTAEQVMLSQAAVISGCSGTAKVFAKLARSLGLAVRYVATVTTSDYREKCCYDGTCTGHPPLDAFSSGHQVVAVQMPDATWQLLDTGGAFPASWATLPKTDTVYVASAAPDVSSAEGGMSPDGSTAVHVIFPSQGPESDHMIVAAETDGYFDNLGLDVANTLDNLYASGHRSINICAFNP